MKAALRTGGATLISLWIFAAVTPACGATIKAATCSQEDVRFAISSAVSGDTVDVPAGSCAWDSNGVLLPSAKTIVLRGAGVDVTTITSANGAYSRAVWMGESGKGSSSRVTGFTFKRFMETIQVDGDGWRVDHCKISNDGKNSWIVDGVYVPGYREGKPYGTTGLIDHVTFIDARVVVYGGATWADEHALWASPLGLGDSNAVYIEDCKFTNHGQPNIMDANCGARYVFRHNVVQNSSIDCHSVQGGNRATRRWEIYNNTIQLTSDAAYFTPIFLRGGTGVIFNNTITGSWGEPYISFDNVRSYPKREEVVNYCVNGDCRSNPPWDQTHPGYCDTNSPGNLSPWDGNQHTSGPDIGWPARDQIGRGGDTRLWTTGNPYPPQTSEPVYLWNNTINGLPAQVNIRNWTGPYIQEGRDYFNNKQRNGYVPYTYPHPLQGIKPGANLLPTGFPGVFRALQVTAKPFSNSIAIELDGNAAFAKSIKVYSLHGRQVADLSASFTGRSELQWNAANLTNGLYLVRASIGGQVRTAKMLLQN